MSATGHQWPGPSTYHGLSTVAGTPERRTSSSPAIRAATYAFIAGAGCATLT